MSQKLKIAICDYSGHAFPAQLSRELARRGYNLLHLHFAEFQSPKGRLTRAPDDPSTLEFAPVSLGRPFAKYAFIRRRAQEIEIGHRLAARIAAFAPDIAVACNLPLDSLNQIAMAGATSGFPIVFWQQDVYSVAIDRILSRKLGILGRMIGAHYRKLERRLLHGSAAIVVISGDFVGTIESEFGVSPARVTVIENWAPIEEIPMLPQANEWSRAHGLAGREIVLYSGTLGMKHDPGGILAIAESLRDRPNTNVVVISESPAAEWLASQAAERNLPGLRVMPFQPFASFPQVLATAEVLIGCLEPDAGVFSVPSKVLSYLCAARPIVLAAPAGNLASHIVAQSAAGKIVPPGDSGAFVAAVQFFLNDPAARAAAGKNGRAYAERTFDIEAIAGRFETIFGEVTKFAKAS